MNDLPEYDGMTRRGTRYEVRVSVPPDVAAALHEEAVRRDVGPGVVARGWMREYRAGVTAGRGVTMDMVRVALDEVGVDTVRLAAWKAAGEALSPFHGLPDARADHVPAQPYIDDPDVAPQPTGRQS